MASRLRLSFVFVSCGLFIAIACGSSSGPACGNTTCLFGEICCNTCGTDICSQGGCPAIMCAGDSGTIPCGATSCSLSQVCCTDCSGHKSCALSCPGVMCDSGTDSPSDAPPESSSDAKQD